MKSYGFKSKSEYLEEYRIANMTKVCKYVEQSICTAIGKGEDEVEIVFSDGKHPLIPLEDEVNEIQDLLRESGFQVTRNANITGEDGYVYPFSLKVKWNWKIETITEKIDGIFGEIEVTKIK